MSRSLRPRTLPQDADAPTAARALEHERVLLRRQYAEMQMLYQVLKRSNKWLHGSEEDWENFMVTVRYIIDDVHKNLDYIDAQLVIIQKGLRAFETDDPEAIKAAAKEYLLSDVSMSLRNLALHRYDNNEIIRQLKEYEAI
jgi:hypothetical protein